MNAADLQAVLEGRDPHSGERLVSASGSAGRRALRVGEATRIVDGQPVWGVRDLSRRLDADPVAIRQVAAGLDPGVFVADGDGRRWLSAKGVDAVAEALDVAEAEPISLAGDPGEVLTVAQCADITGSSRYLRRALERADRDRDLITAVDAGLDYHPDREGRPTSSAPGSGDAGRSNDESSRRSGSDGPHPQSGSPSVPS